MILYDKSQKIGDISSNSSIELHTGKSYTVTYDIPIEKWKMPASSVISYQGKTAVLMSVSRNPENWFITDVKVLIPGNNPFPIFILIYGLAALFAGLGVYLASTNIVKVVEDVTKPSGVIWLAAAAFIYLKFFAK